MAAEQSFGADAGPTEWAAWYDEYLTRAAGQSARVSELYQEVTDEMLVEAAHDPEHLRLLRELGFSSAMVVPLAARGRVIGAMTLVSAESGRRFDAADLGLGEQPVAPRFGLAPGGVYPAGLSPDRWCALTAPFHRCRRRLRAGGCVVSVALSLGLPPLAVNQHPAMRCPDFPRAARVRPAAAWPATIRVALRAPAALPRPRRRG